MAVAAFALLGARMDVARRLGRRLALPGWLRKGAAVRGLGLGLLVLLLALRYWDPAPLQTMRLQTFDVYQTIAPRLPTEFPVAVADIDEQSLAALGQWPWPRTLMAELLRKLFAAGVAGVAIDIVFPEPDRMSPARIAAALPQLDGAVRGALERLPGNDSVLADLLQKAPVVLARALQPSPIPGQDGVEVRRPSVATIGGDPRPFVFRFPGIVVNTPVLEAAARGHGVITLLPERDGVVRRVPAVLRYGRDLLLALSIELLRVALGQPSFAIKSGPGGIRSIVLKGLAIPTDQHGRIWIRWAPHDARRYVSVKDVLDGSLPAGRLSRRLVVISSSATGLLDIKTTPLGQMPGGEIQAQIVEALLTKSFLQRPSWAAGAEMGLVLGTGLMLILLAPMVGARWTVAVVLVQAGGLAATSWYLFKTSGILLDVSYPTVAGILLYTGLTYASYVREQAEKRWVRGAFGRYLSPAVVSRLAADPGSLRLGGEMREMTLLFCDVRGFTTISEQFDAAGLTRFINRFLTPMTGVILSFGGTIDKYMGDAIMAFWGAPVMEARHARLGCEAALGMRLALAELNRRLAAEASAAGQDELAVRVGIGLNTGMCCVGNMGSDQRFDYSVLGDDVNLASRLEGQSKTYGVDIVISESTRAAAGAGLATLELDLVRVKGKTRPVRIHVLLGEAAADDGFAALSAAHEALLAAYRGQDWAGAARELAACRACSDGRLAALYDLYEARIAAFRAQPPGPDWDGVTIAETK